MFSIRVLGRGICGVCVITVMGERGDRAWCGRYITKTPSMNASRRINSFSHDQIIRVNISRLSYTGDMFTIYPLGLSEQ